MCSNPNSLQGASLILGYHGEEDAKLRVHVNHISICEDKLLLLVLLTLQDNVDLLGSHREDWKLDAVEFIKAAPGSSLGQTCRDTQDR